MEILKPCPFCGCAEIEQIRLLNNIGWYFRCGDCRIEQASYPTYKEATEAWNRRSVLDKEDRQLIHCKDCAYLGFKDFRGICEGAVCHPITPEDFCSFAKRRKE